MLLHDRLSGIAGHYWFGDWKERRGYRRCRYVGLAMNQLHLMLLAMAHNLRRMVVLSTA